MGLVQIAAAVAIRIPALYLAISRIGFYKIESGTLLMLSLFSAMLGFLMPATDILDIGGVLFRIALFTVIVMIVMRVEIGDAFGIVFVAAIIESLIILFLMISPLSWLVAGMNPLTIP